MELKMIDTAREALDRMRYDPPAWTGTQILWLAVVVLASGIMIWILASASGADKVRAAFDARIAETRARVEAEGRAKIAELETALAEERAKAAAENARFEEREAALLAALDASARPPATQVAGACETPVEPLNAVIAEVNRGRR